MPPEPPTPPNRPRPGAGQRRKALGLSEASDEAATPAEAPAPAAPATPAPGAAPAVGTRESLAASLARIPDLSPDEVVDPDGSQAVQMVAPVAPPAEPPGAPVPPLGVAPEVDAPEVDAPEVEAAEETVAPRASTAPPSAGAPLVATDAAASATAHDGEGGKGRRTRIAPPPKPPWWRRAAFAVAMVVFVAAIPALGYTGSRLIAESKAGDFQGSTLGPTDPGFEAQVEPTPTALAIQYDDEGVPNSLTFLSMSGDAGGTVVFVPLDTELAVAKFGIGNVRLAWEATPRDQPTLGRDRIVNQVASILNVGIQEPIELTNASWEQLVAPVGPLKIDNPDAIDLGFGITIPSGETELPANLVGAYLAKRVDGESDLTRLVRHEAVWRAWLDQVGEAGTDDAVPGETGAGIGRFVRVLAAGDVDIQTLPTDPSKSGPNLYARDQAAINRLMTDAVASPTAATPGSRFTVRLLNGVSPDAIPGEFVHQLVGMGGAVTILGNGPEFDTDETTVVYGDPAMKATATFVAAALGAKGEVRFDREAPDTVDLTIVLGNDLLGEVSSGDGLPGSTVPTDEGD